MRVCYMYVFILLLEVVQCPMRRTIQQTVVYCNNYTIFIYAILIVSIQYLSTLRNSMYTTPCTFLYCFFVLPIINYFMSMLVVQQQPTQYSYNLLQYSLDHKLFFLTNYCFSTNNNNTMVLETVQYYMGSKQQSSKGVVFLS